MIKFMQLTNEDAGVVTVVGLVVVVDAVVVPVAGGGLLATDIVDSSIDSCFTIIFILLDNIFFFNHLLLNA